MTPPAKSPRQDAKAVIEAWACVNPAGKIYTLGTDYDAVVDEIADSPLFWDYRIVRLTSAPPTAPDGRGEALEREVKRLRKALKSAQFVVKDNYDEVAAFGKPNRDNAWWPILKMIRAALTPAKKGRVKP